MKEKKALKKQLDNELKDLQFTKQDEVLNRINPTTWKQKVASIWNKEIELPLLPLSAACVLVLFIFGANGFTIDNDRNKVYKEKVLIEVGGYVYWKDQLEKAVTKYEN